MRCTKHRCGGTIESVIGALGQVSYHCARCERKKRRICRDCDQGTPSAWHWRCLRCAKRHRRELERPRDRRRYAKRKKRTLARWKRRMQDPAFRAHRAAYMAEYRRKHPRDAFDRAYGRAYMQALRSDPTYRAREQRRKRLARRTNRKAA